MPTHWIAFVAYVANDLVEESVRTAMSGDDGESAAPLGNGFGDAVEKALILVKGEFVDFHMATFSRESVWVGGEAVDATAIREL